MRLRVCVWLACVWACAARAAGSVVVVQLQLGYDEVHSLPLNRSLEYILEFTPPAEAGERPSVVWVRSDGGDGARPVLLTARQRAGAETWQLPYSWGGRAQWELQRTLCPDDTADDADDPACADESPAEGSRGSFSLHVSSSCAAQVTVSVRVTLPPSWRLPFLAATPLSVAPTLPSVVYYQFGAEQDSVRLVLASDDDVCATVSVHPYDCPVPQTAAAVRGVGAVGAPRMTVMRSGAVQLSRLQYPRGFFVVALVSEAQSACSWEEDGGEEDAADMYAAALFGNTEPPRTAARLVKNFEYTIQASLTSGEYAVAVAVTLALFLAFYVGFGAVVLAQRWPPCFRLVGPKAVLADTTRDSENPDNSRLDDSMTPSRRRRGSDATFDSSDDSDTDEEDTVDSTVPSPHRPSPAPRDVIAAPGDVTAADAPGPRDSSVSVTAGSGRVFANGNGAVVAFAGSEGMAPEQPAADIPPNTEEAQAPQGPFGLPARLRLAALARRRARTLRARSDRYLYTLYTVAVFYALPVVQFVFAFQMVLIVSGSLDICYYNFLCAHPAGALSDFNHVLSNLGYLLLGALFMLQDYGIPAHYGLLSALGAGMMVVALLSASYHVCPNQLNFQFDTAFMYVLAVLSMVKIYQSRHPDVNARAHATFGVLAVLIAVVVWGVLGGGPLFWGMFTVVHVFTFLLLSLRIYYVGQFRLEREVLAQAARELQRDARPQYGARLLLLLIGNAVNWVFAIYGLLTQSQDIASHLLQVLLGNTLLYMVFYLVMKLVHGERLRWYSVLSLAAAAAAWAPALYFFVHGNSSWSSSPALSRHKNHECKVLQFYDSHDLWHMLSAVALYLSFTTMLTWDDGLSAVKRTEIPVF